MSGPPIEQDYILDADGRQIMTAIDMITAKLANIQREVSKITATANEGGKNFDKTLTATLRQMQKAAAELRTIQMPGAQIQSLNNNRQAAKQTLQATEYARELNTARNAAEALTAKIAKLNQVVAARGQNGGAATVATTDKLKKLEQAASAIRKLDAQYDALEAKARRTKGADFSAQFGAVNEARDRLFTAASSPRRTNLTPEVNALSDAQAQLAERITLARRAEAQALQTSYRLRKEMAVAEAEGLKTSTALDRARVQNAERIRELRTQAKTATGEEANAILRALELEKARGRQLATNTREVEAQVRAEQGLGFKTTKALIPAQMRADAQQYGATTVSAGAQFEKELALRRLSAATTDQERIAALQALDLANARVAAAARLVTEEKRVLAEINSEAETLRRAETLRGRGLAGPAARSEIGAVGLDQAQANAKQRILDLQTRLASATAQEVRELSEQIALEKTKLGFINQEVVAREREAAATARGVAQSERAAAAEQRNSIGGRVQRAAGNTALYGGVAMVGFGALGVAQQGVSYVVELEDELAKLQAISNSTTTQMQELKASIFEVGDSSRFSLGELAKISQTLAQAGISAGEMGKVLSSVTTLATASGSTPDEAVNLVTSALGSFQLQGSEAARVADLMTSALNRTKLTVGQVGQAIQYVGATAFEQNISLEQLLATVGAMAQAGIKSGSTIGTGLRQLFVDLQTPSTKLIDQLKAVGLTVADVNVAVNGEQAVLDKLASSGFGATQAYAGLETRAAAAYLVLKNNRDVIDELQIGFANAGAAADANARAMDSLSAQWQRFINIIGADIFEGAEGGLKRVQTLVMLLADGYETLTGAVAKAQQNLKDNKYYDDGSTITGLLSKLKDEALTTGGLSGFDVMMPQLTVINKLLDEYRERNGGASRASEELKTRIAENADAISTQRGVIGEVEKEMGRLITQHSSLSGNTLRTDAETVNLTTRFVGLAQYLTNAKDKYGDLINAMKLYNQEASRTLADQVSGQISLAQEQGNQARGNAGAARAKVLNNKEFMNSLTAQERLAFQKPEEGRNALVVGSVARRTNNPDALAFSRSLGDMAAAASTVRSGLLSLNDIQARLGETGTRLNNSLITTQSGLTELGGLSGKDRTTKATETLKQAEAGYKETNDRANRLGPKSMAYATLIDMREGFGAVVKGVKAALAPTKADEKEAKERETAAAKAEREAKAGPRAGQKDVDAVGRVIGLPLGSGQRTAAEQNSLHARGLTPATAETSGHSRPGGAARDFPTGDVSQAQGEAYAAAARKYFKDQGIPVVVKYENGHGKNQGTGKHVHVNLLPGARVSPKGENDAEQSAYDAQTEIDKSGTAVDKRTFSNAVKDIRDGTSQEVIDSTGELLKKLGGELERDAIAELAKKGIVDKNSPQFKERMGQVEDERKQLLDQYNDAVAQGLIKNLELQVKAATDAFTLAIAPATDMLARSQAALSGLDSYSLQNKVPDYVKVIASQRVAKDQEGLSRARLEALPAQIAITQQASDQAEANLRGMDKSDSGYAATKAEATNLALAVHTLRTEQDALNISLNAGVQIPTTLAGAFAAATEAYRATHAVVTDFRTLVIDNMGGALDAVSTGLTDMFTSIFTGSQTALGAFANFAKGMINYIQQIAAKAVAGKIFELLLNVGASFIGGSKPAASGSGPSLGLDSLALGRFDGGPIQAYARGGRVANGSDARDSVNAKLAKGEWVVRKKAVDSVGNNFMANLNRHGAKAMAGMGAVPNLPAPAKQETSVYVVAPEQKPSMGPNDVLVTLHNDILSGGETKKLIKYVAQGG